jgi:hypothetical protein
MKYALVLSAIVVAACASHPSHKAAPAAELPTNVPNTGPDLEAVTDPAPIMPDNPLEGLTADVIAVNGTAVTIDTRSKPGTPWLIRDRHGGIGWVEVARAEETYSVCEMRGDFEIRPRPGHAAIIGERLWIEPVEPKYNPGSAIAPMPMAPHPLGPWTLGGAPQVERPRYAYAMLAYVGVLGPPREGGRTVTTVWGDWSPQCSLAQARGNESGWVVLVEDEGLITAFPYKLIEEEFKTWPQGTVLISFITPKRLPVASRD